MACCPLPACPLQVMEAAGKHQVLIFVHSRKETAKTARWVPVFVGTAGTWVLPVGPVGPVGQRAARAAALEARRQY